MNIEKIEQAAHRWAEGEITKSRIERAERAFKAGADWRINSVWHENLDESETERQFIVEFTNGRIGIFDDIRVIKDIKDLVARFAYIDDLLPKRKEENND